MRLYIIRPTGAWNADGTYNDAVYAITTPVISQMVFNSLTPERDRSLYTVRRVGEGTVGPERPADEVIGIDSIHYVRTPEELLDWITRSVDPGSGFWTPIRSRINCRQVLFGYDGQALMCLRLEDPPPISPMPDIISVIDDTSELITWDGFDGFGFDEDENGETV